jgi:hypothetical protein
MPAGRLMRTLLEPLEWTYPTAKALYMWRMGRVHRSYSKGPILLLQMGKVGSKSVQAGLEALDLDRAIYHAHFLSRERTALTEKQRRKFFRTDQYNYLRRPWLNQFLLRAFQDRDDQRKWKLITLTREPVGRNISAFFENLEVKPGAVAGEYEIHSDYYNIEPTTVTVRDTDVLTQLFVERATHDSPLKFFDREIRDIFGIDVFAEKFSPEKGYGIYHSDRADLLVMRLESLAGCAERALHEYLGIESFKIVNRNIGAKKVYAPLYDAFKRGVVIDSGYANTLYDSQFMQTFYSSEEIAAAKSKWLRHVSENVA